MWSHRLLIKNTAAMFFSDKYGNRVNCYRRPSISETRLLFFLWLWLCVIVTSNTQITKLIQYADIRWDARGINRWFLTGGYPPNAGDSRGNIVDFCVARGPNSRFFSFFISNALFRAVRKPTGTGSWNCSSSATAEGRKKNMNIKNTRHWRERQRGNAANAECYPPYTQTSVAIVPLYCGENPLLAERLRASHRKRERDAGRLVVETGRNYNSLYDDHNGRWYWLWW